jgi:hypothetical protein
LTSYDGHNNKISGPSEQPTSSSIVAAVHRYLMATYGTEQRVLQFVDIARLHFDFHKESQDTKSFLESMAHEIEVSDDIVRDVRKPLNAKSTSTELWSPIKDLQSIATRYQTSRMFFESATNMVRTAIFGYL